MNLIEKMELYYPQMTESERKVCRIIRQDPSVIVTYTIVQTAMIADTSTSAVLRFTQRLGFKGYKDFRYELMNWLRDSRGSKQQETDVVTSLSMSFSEMIRQIGEIDRDLIRSLASDILNVDKVILLGRYRNSVLAEKLKMNLNDLGVTCLAAADLISYQHLLYVITPDTCVILFSALGEIADMKDFMTQLKDSGCHSWLITANPKAKAAKYSGNMITIPSLHPGQYEHVTSHCIAMAFNEILTAVCGEMKMHG